MLSDINLVHKEMRSVNHQYIQEVQDILNKSQIPMSNKRLRRLAYFDVHFQSYKQFDLYNKSIN